MPTAQDTHGIFPRLRTERARLLWYRYMVQEQATVTKRLFLPAPRESNRCVVWTTNEQGRCGQITVVYTSMYLRKISQRVLCAATVAVVMNA